jgi:hypothetical protein
MTKANRADEPSNMPTADEPNDKKQVVVRKTSCVDRD